VGQDGKRAPTLEKEKKGHFFQMVKGRGRKGKNDYDPEYMVLGSYYQWGKVAVEGGEGYLKGEAKQGWNLNHRENGIRLGERGISVVFWGLGVWGGWGNKRSRGCA